jgi:hypothetical protein
MLTLAEQPGRVTRRERATEHSGYRTHWITTWFSRRRKNCASSMGYRSPVSSHAAGPILRKKSNVAWAALRNDSGETEEPSARSFRAAGIPESRTRLSLHRRDSALHSVSPIGATGTPWHENSHHFTFLLRSALAIQ